MRSLKFLATLLFGIFLINFASAIVSLGEWQDGSDEISIMDGESVSFEVDYFSMNPSMVLSTKLYDSQYNELHVFMSETIAEYGYYNTFTITPAMYATAGTFEIIILGTDSVGSSYTYTLSLTVNPISIPQDTTAPTITLLGDNPQTIELGNSYIELGATATDDSDGDISSSIDIDSSSVNTSLVGTYEVSYNVEDTAGNFAQEKTRTVNVIDSSNPDMIAPTITLLGTSSITILLDSVYEDAGATAFDDEDGDLTSDIIVNNSVNTSVLGTYNVTYNVQDSAGNDAVEVVRNVTVVLDIDDQAPTITIIYPKDKTYTSRTRLFKVKTDESAVVEFSLDGRSNVTMDKISDYIFEYEKKLSYGTHELVFYATDASGNVGVAEIEFKIKRSRKNDDDDPEPINIFQTVNESVESVTLSSGRSSPKLGWIVILLLAIGILIMLLLIILIKRSREEVIPVIYDKNIYDREDFN